MIVFLNFAPIEFMGGAERWMLEISDALNTKHEPSILLSLEPSLSNLYSRIILKRKFNKRVNIKKNYKINFIYINYKHFIPFTKENKKLREIFNNARIIYFKLEINEFLILLYFGGIKLIKKSIGGIHSPLIYKHPNTVFETIHNYLYNSRLWFYLTLKLKTIHIISKNDITYFQKKIKFKNVVYCINSIPFKFLKMNKIKSSKKYLNILFIGELSQRKGTDIIVALIKNLTDQFKLTIVGSGPDAEKISSICKNNINCRYMGRVNPVNIHRIFDQNDVLFLPSRAEGFPIVFHESMIHGLLIVDSIEINQKLPNFIEYSSKNIYSDYINTFKKILILKKAGKMALIHNKISKYYKSKLSFTKIEKNLYKNIFDI